ncbi:hypothetical protein [Deinococcus aestuarii]|uniref:hypothetical protein n=1 Tax=Deinococcus aestuarii TaxID=2774531 RepID=UPI001C0D0849|nr:hypothetical protein [Deinococcus aestuarii]
MTALTRFKLAQLDTTLSVSALLGQVADLTPRPTSTRGRPRAGLPVPVTPGPDVVDTVLFEDPVNPAARFWLPRYALATEETSGGPHYQARLAAQGGGWRLDLTLRRYAAPELGALPADARVLDHTVLAGLRWERGGVLRERPFTERGENPDGTLGLALTVGTLPERDELYTALTTPEGKATLIVTRGVRVAVRVPDEPAPVVRPRKWKGGAFDEDPGPRFPSRRWRGGLFAEEPGPRLPPRRWRGGALDEDSATRDHLPVPVVARLAGRGVGPGLARARAVTGLTPLQPLHVRPRPDLSDLLVRPDRIPPLIVNSVLATPQLTVGEPEVFDQGGEPWARYPLRVTNAAEYGDDLFAPAPDLPPCGANANSARTWVDIFDAGNTRLYGFCALGRARDLEGLWVAVRAGGRPAGVSVELVDRRAGLSARSATVALPPLDLFEVVERALTGEEALLFHPGLHAYVFPGLGTPTGGGGSLIPRTVPFGGASHRYYQDEVRHEVFYALPDSFKLAREADPPRRPRLTLECLAPDRYRLTFAARPTFDLDRLEGARVGLARHLPAGHPGPVRLEPFHTSQVSFVPVDAGLYTKGGVQTTNLGELRGTVELEGAAFARVWDELTGALPVSLGGKLRAEVGGLPAEEVPVALRLDDTVGECVVVTAEPDPDSGGYRVRLINALESPLRLGQPTPFVASLKAPEEGLRPARWEKFVALADLLAPGDEARGLLKPVADVPLADYVPVVDTDRVRAVPDLERITQGMLVGVVRTFGRTVTAEVPADVFAAPPDPAHPGRRLLAVHVHFEGGDTAELLRPADPGVLLVRGEATVMYPLLDLLLGRPPGEYRYRVLPVYTDGPGQPGEWKAASTDLLSVGLG